jgi:hypothetical protein
LFFLGFGNSVSCGAAFRAACQTLSFSIFPHKPGGSRPDTYTNRFDKKSAPYAGAADPKALAV